MKLADSIFATVSSQQILNKQHAEHQPQAASK
jgi:hypothetical protein